jgi:hypothetical protein
VVRYLKERVIWRNGSRRSTRRAPRSAPTSTTTHDRPHLGIEYRTPKEVKQTWEDAREQFDGLQKQAA